MNAFEILKDEHRVIEQVLGCLEKIAQEAVSRGSLDGEAAGDTLDFLRNFADGCHHAKEEVHLFPMMEASGFPREGGPTGVMLYEHELGRSHVRGMAEHREAAAAGNTEAILQFAAHAREFIRLLRDHIQKEDHCLFPMAAQAFDAEKTENLSRSFDQVEKEEIGQGVHEKWLGVANALAERYGVPRAETGAHSGGGCPHH